MLARLLWMTGNFVGGRELLALLRQAKGGPGALVRTCPAAPAGGKDRKAGQTIEIYDKSILET